MSCVRNLHAEKDILDDGYAVRSAKPISSFLSDGLAPSPFPIVGGAWWIAYRSDGF